MVRGTSCVEAEAAINASHLHSKIEHIDASGVDDVVGVDVPVAEDQRSPGLVGPRHEMDGSGSPEVVTHTGSLDQLGRGEIVGTVQLRIIQEVSSDHIDRVANTTEPNRGSCHRRAHKTGAPHPSGRTGTTHPTGAGRCSLHQHTPSRSAADASTGELDKSLPARHEAGAGHCQRPARAATTGAKTSASRTTK